MRSESTRTTGFQPEVLWLRVQHSLFTTKSPVCFQLTHSVDSGVSTGKGKRHVLSHLTDEQVDLLTQKIEERTLKPTCTAF